MCIRDRFKVFKPTLAILKKTIGTKKLRMVPVFGSRTKNLDVSKFDQTRFSITDNQAKTLAKWGMAVEEHYGKPMDIEWALDGLSLIHI